MLLNAINQVFYTKTETGEKKREMFFIKKYKQKLKLTEGRR